MKNYMSKKNMKWICRFTFLICLMMTVRMSVCVHAATPRMISLRQGRTYKQYDVTGDRKADRLKVTNSYYYGTRVYVNGKIAFQRSYGSEWIEKANIVILKNGKTFLYLQVNDGGDYSSTSFMLQYKSGRLKNVLNPTSDIWHNSGARWWFTLKKVSGNSVLLQISIRNPSLSWIDANVSYQYKNNKFVIKKRTVGVSYYTWNRNKTQKTTRNLQLYRSATSGSKAGVLKKGVKGRVTKVYLGKKNIRFYVVGTNGKKGWFNSLKRARYAGYRTVRDFENLVEAS